jgi:hypothetical protein
MLMLWLLNRSNLMKVSFLLVLVLFSVFNSGCNKSSDSEKSNDLVSNGVVIADGSGFCSQAMIDAHNDVVYSRSSIDKKNKCERFKLLIGTNSCKAKKIVDSNESTISSASLDKDCSDRVSTTITPDKSSTYNPDYSSNTCSVATISEVQELGSAATAYSADSSGFALKRLVDSCNRLKALTNGIPCYRNGTELNYDVSFKKGCEQVNEAYNGSQQPVLVDPNPELVAGTPVPSELTDELHDKKVLTVTLVQPNTLTTKLNAATNGTAAELIFQNGKVIAKEVNLDLKQPRCFLTKDSEFKALSSKQTKSFSVNTYLGAKDIIVLKDSDVQINIMCMGGSNTPFTFSDFKKVFAGWIEAENVN